jgi:hypothetical protein
LRGSGDDNEPSTNNLKQDSRQLNKRTFFWTGQTVQTSKTKTEAPAEMNKQRRRSTSRLVYENNLPGSSSTALDPSFWKEDLNKSFIDISPDRKARWKGRGIVGKERMKSLLSKANELFSWGRSQRKVALAQGERDRLDS